MAQETQNRTSSGDQSLEESGAGEGLSPGLHLLATPIGSVRDLSLRGRDALRHADVLVCEDSRVLRRLMDLHDAPLRGRPILAYHEHNAETARPKILAHLEQGRSVVLTSDAGTPLIADPGYKLVRAVRSAGHTVTALPGPCAAIAALILSGLPTDAFSFIGFPPTKAGPRHDLFERWSRTPGSLILYESPRRVAETLQSLSKAMGPAREAVVARELTKRFEEIRSGRLEELARTFADAEPPKGEVVIVVGPPIDAEIDEQAIDAMLASLLENSSVKDAVKIVAEQLDAPKKLVYARALAIKG